MDKLQSFAKDFVNENEVVARIVLSPHDMDVESGRPKDGFIKLREDEKGISFLRYDFLGKDGFYNRGEARRIQYSNKKREQEFIGWMQCVVKVIKALDPESISLLIEKPDESPEHVLVCFKRQGEIVRGIVTDAYILALIDELYQSLEFVKIA